MIGIQLAEVVEGYQRKRGQAGNHRYDHYLEIAKSGLNLMHRQTTGSIKAVVQSVNQSNGSIKLPKGCVKVKSIFLFDSEGQIKYLSKDNNMHSVPDDCGDIVTKKEVDAGGYGGGIASHIEKGYANGAYYNLGGGSVNGSWSYNSEYGRIEMSSNMSASLALVEYIGLPERVNGSFMVHPYLVEALEEYIHYGSMKFKRNMPVSQIDYWDNKWNMSALQASVDINGMSFKQIIDASLKSVTLAPKLF